jgi:hypothetical protein
LAEFAGLGFVGIFSFLLNFFWEMQQMPFYQFHLSSSYFDADRNCTHRDRWGRWNLDPLLFLGGCGDHRKSGNGFITLNTGRVSSFIPGSVVITVIFEL